MNNEVPKVKSKVGAQKETAKVTGAINVVVPGDFPNGESKPTLVSSVDELYKKFGITSEPAAEDNPALLQASSILGIYPVWVVRAHKNKVFEGLTDSGEKIYFDENKDIIRHRLNLTVGINQTSFNNMYVVCGDTVFYVGELPETISAPIQVPLSIENPTYDKFFTALMTDPSVYNTGNLFIVNSNNNAYTIWSKNAITSLSNNLVRISTSEVGLSKIKFGADDFDQSCYILINDTAYINAGLNASAYVYPGDTKALPFIHESDNQPASAFALYFYDTLMGSSDKKYVSVNNISLKRTLSDNTLTINSNITSLDYSEGVISVYPNSETAKGKYLVLSNGTKDVVIHNGYAIESLNLHDNPLVFNTSCNTIYRLVERISEEIDGINEFFSSELTILDESIYDLYLNDGQMVSFGYNLPLAGSSTITEESVVMSKFGDNAYNTQNMKITNCGVRIDETEYYVGESSSVATLATDKVQISALPIKLSDFVNSLTRALPNSYNASFEDNVISIFISTDQRLATNSEGEVSVSTKDISFVGIEEGNTFAFILKSNAKAKVAKFNWKWNDSDSLYDFSATVNGETYSRSIEFTDSTRVDGYGSSLYYDAFNKNFSYGEIIKIGDQRSLSEYESPLFGNGVPIMEPSVADLQTALKQLRSYKFTKFEIMADGGFVDPSYITVMDSICKDIKCVLYSGTKVSRYVKDIVEFRNNCPANSWNTYLATPRLSDNTLGQFTVYMSPAIQYIKRILNNAKVGDEFEAVFGSDKGSVSGTPEFDFDPETDQEELIQASVNTVYHSDEAEITYFNDNYTLVNEKNPMQEECVVRLINAATHVAEIWLERNTIARKNTLKLRNTVRDEVKKAIEQRLQSNETPYTDLQVICNESNGNIDGSETLYVTATCRPYGSVHIVELFTLAKTLSSTSEE